MQTPQLEQLSQQVDAHQRAESTCAQKEWLCWLHDMLPDAEQLMLFRVNLNQTIELAALNPSHTAPSDIATNAVRSCVHSRRAIYLDAIATAPSAHHLLAIPFQIETAGSAYVLVMLTQALSKIQQNTAVKLSHWAATRLTIERAGKPPESTLAAGPEAQLAQALIDSLERHGTHQSLAFSLVNTLVSLCGCLRVSLGAYDGRQFQLVAMSGQSKIDSRRKIVKQMCALMQELRANQRTIYPNKNGNSAPALQSYFKSQGEHPLLGFVMPGCSATQYVLVLERCDASPFAEAQADAIEQSVHNLSPLLELVQTHELPVRRKVVRYIRNWLDGVTGFKRWSGKQCFAALLCAALILSLFIPVTHRISADATIEASDRQVLVAAQDGFILSAHARAGEVVKKGDLLATLDGQDLELAAQKWRSEKAKNQQEFAQALAIHDRSELSRLRADVQRIDAEIALLEQQISRSEVRAPFDGVLLDGDWTQSLGAPVTTGDVLFEIASAEKYRLILEIDEHDIGYILPDQPADLRMAALPTQVWKAQLGDVMPVAVSEKGSSAFRVPAIIDGDAPALRPGMEGVGKVSIGQRSIFWVCSHKLFEKIRYLSWKLGLL